MAWIRCCGSADIGEKKPTYLIGTGAASFNFTIPNNATYILTFNRSIDTDIPSITNCNYIGSKIATEYDFSSYPSGTQPSSTTTVRIFEVSQVGSTTITQQGSTQIGYLTTRSA